MVQANVQTNAQPNVQCKSQLKSSLTSNLITRDVTSICSARSDARSWKIPELLVQKISVPELLVQSARKSQALFSIYKHIGNTNMIRKSKCHLFFSGNLSSIELGFKNYEN